MLQQIPEDVWSRVESLMAGGGFASEADVLRKAVALLEDRKVLIADIQAGLEDYAAGRYHPIEELEEEFREQNGI